MDDDKLLLSVPAAAALMSVSTATAYQAVADGLWPVVRLGRRGVRVPREALIAWVRDQTVMGAAEGSTDRPAVGSAGEASRAGSVASAAGVGHGDDPGGDAS